MLRKRNYLQESVLSESIFDNLVKQEDLLDIEDNVDEGTFRLIVDIYSKLNQRFQLSNDEQYALNALTTAIKLKSKDNGNVKNMVHKAAIGLGLKVKSSMF